MTIIECFEKSPIENMVSTLTANPEKLILIGESEEMEASARRYQKFLTRKGYRTAIQLQNIDRNNLPVIIGSLRRLLMAEEDCVIDITGGEDLLLLAVGILYEQLKNTHPFKMQRFNIETGKIIDIDGDHEVLFRGRFSLTVKELVSLYGGIVAPETPQPEESASITEVNTLWDIARQNPGRWNDSMKFLNILESRSYLDGQDLQVLVPMEALPDCLLHSRHNQELLLELLRSFSEAGLIKELSVSEHAISYTYRSRLIRRCLRKAGDVLEMKTYFEVRNLRDRDHSYFTDCFISVSIDWDGILHSAGDSATDTRNEIDVIAMRGLVPLFISCKNGKIGEEELYKLNTVALRFGGKYARKMLIASHLDTELPATQSMLQRAKDMGIRLVPRAAELTDSQWADLFTQMF